MLAVECQRWQGNSCPRNSADSYSLTTCPVWYHPCRPWVCKDRPSPFPGWMSYKATKPSFSFYFLLHAVNCVRFCFWHCLWLFCLWNISGNLWTDLCQIQREDLFGLSLGRVGKSKVKVTSDKNVIFRSIWQSACCLASSLCLSYVIIFLCLLVDVCFCDAWFSFVTTKLSDWLQKCLQNDLLLCWVGCENLNSLNSLLHLWCILSSISLDLIPCQLFRRTEVHKLLQCHYRVIE